jgi:hypothetical protein
MTFTAGGAGLPGLTMMTVRVTNSALDAVSGKALYSPYEMRFKTAATSIQDTLPRPLPWQPQRMPQSSPGP